MKVDVYEMPKENISSVSKNSLKNKSIVSTSDLDDDDLEKLFDLTTSLKTQPNRINLLTGKTIACLFYEASTRTYASFIAATTKLGGSAIPIQGVAYSSVSKGETLEDTIKTLAQYADAIVLRHPENDAAARAASAAGVYGIPIINAGSGSLSHPTQSFTDLFTIKSKLDKPDGKTFSFIGDLKYSRTVHSLIQLLWRYKNVKLNFVSPDPLKLPTELLTQSKKFCDVNEFSSVEQIIQTSDCLYTTRPQTERMTEIEKAQKVNQFDKERFTLNKQMMINAKPTAIILHPLPRQSELSTDLDTDPRACYFDQVQNGLYVRMALLLLVLGREFSC